MDDASTRISDAHKELLQKFKRNVADILKPYETDAHLLKWLKARNYHLRKSEHYFREMYAFKQLYSLDTVCDTFVKPEAVEKYEYTAFLGYAKDGSMIRYTQAGRGDHYGIIQTMSPYQVGLYASQIIEEDVRRQRLRYKETGENIHRATYIFDLSGLVLQDIMHKCVYEVAMDLMHLVQDYYPEIWGNIFVLNVPPYFDTIFNMFKPILRMNVIERLQLVSRDSIGEVLLKYIDEDVLPAFLGGKRIDSSDNPKCSEFLRFGGKIPRKYYIRNQPPPPLLPTEPGVTSKWIGARSVFNHSVVVHKPNTKIQVQVRTESGSIYMSIYYRKFGPNIDVTDVPGENEHLDEKDDKYRVKKVSPGMRVQTHLSPINDYNTAPWPGIYIYRFNNSHNWLYSRRLIFRIKLIEDDS